MPDVVYLSDRVKEISYTLGTGNFLLSGPVQGFSSFSSFYKNNDIIFYAATNGSAYEVGSGIFVSGVGQFSITRLPFRSSNNNAKISFSEGVKEIYATYPATHSVYTGSGLAGFSVPQDSGIAYWKSSNSLNYDYALVWNDSSKFLGVNKTNPQYGIDVGGFGDTSVIRSSGIIAGSSGIYFPPANDGDGSYVGGRQLTHYEKNRLDQYAYDNALLGELTGSNAVLALSGVANQFILLKKQNAGYVFAGPPSGCTPPCSPDYPSFRQLTAQDVPDLLNVSGILNNRFIQTLNTIVTVSGSLNSRIGAVSGVLRSDLTTVSGSLNSRIDAVSGVLRSDLTTVSGSLNSKIDAVSGVLRSDLTTVSGIVNSLTTQATSDIAQGRLTLQTNTPITVDDQVDKSVVYYTPLSSSSNKIALYDGATWQAITFTEKSLTLTALGSNTNYDIFGRLDAGNLVIEFGLAWTNSSTRSQALTLKDGVLCKASDLTRRYLGTIRTTDSSSARTEDSVSKRFVWNAHNRVSKPLRANIGLRTWTYSTASWRPITPIPASQKSPINLVYGGENFSDYKESIDIKAGVVYAGNGEIINTTTTTTSTTSTTTTTTVAPGNNSANFNGTANWNGTSTGNVTTVGSNGGPSAYGTFDQSGNTYDWTDSDGAITNNRIARGGFWSNDALALSSSYRASIFSSSELNSTGFRLASLLDPLSLNFVTIGNAGNSNDSTGYGGVNYTYKIGKYSVTNCEYVQFLNAVDPEGTNPQGIYNSNMSVEVFGGINFTAGNSNGSKYSSKTNMANKPVNHVSWFDAARYCNWLHNGRLSYSTTAAAANARNTGAYNVGTATTGNVVAKETGASYYIPTENEWYKAAYYKGGGTNAYWLYATQSDTAPTSVTANTTGDGSARVTDYVCPPTPTPSTTTTPAPALNNILTAGQDDQYQLGNGSTIGNKTTYAAITGENSTTRFSSVTCGDFHTFAIRLSDNKPLGCGLNTFGELGTSVVAPTTLISSNLTGAIKIACGSYHTLIIRSDNRLYASGKNGSYQLGNGGTGSTYSFFNIAPFDLWLDISAGSDHSLGITIDGLLYGWGFSAGYRLRPDEWLGAITVPTSLNGYIPNGAGTPAKVFSGNHHNVLITDTGKAMIWGQGASYHGEHGNGTSISNSATSKSSYVLLDPPINGVWTSAACGVSHTLLLSSNGDLYACGRNNNGQIGVGTALRYDSLQFVDTGFSKIAARGFSSYAIKSNGDLYAWGNNSFGQLGLGDFAQTNVPRFVTSNVQSVSAGFYHSAIIK